MLQVASIPSDCIEKQLFQSFLCTARAQTSETPRATNSCCRYVRWVHNRAATRPFSKSAVNPHTHITGTTYFVEAAKRKTGWAAVPAVPKVLGLGGLIPFFALSPPVMQAGASSINHACFLITTRQGHAQHSLLSSVL